MISDEELLVEAKGSAADIAAACSSVKYEIHNQLEPWMKDKQFQVSFEIVIKGDESKIIQAGLSLPEGWALIDKLDHPGSTQTIKDSAHEPRDDCYSSVVKIENDPSSDCVYHSTLNGLLIHTNPQYKANKDQELIDRLWQLAAETKDDEDD